METMVKEFTEEAMKLVEDEFTNITITEESLIPYVTRAIEDMKIVYFDWIEGVTPANINEMFRHMAVGYAVFNLCWDYEGYCDYEFTEAISAYAAICRKLAKPVIKEELYDKIVGIFTRSNTMTVEDAINE